LKKKNYKPHNLQTRQNSLAVPPRNTPTRRMVQVTEATAFSGPIPPPELLKQYNDIIPDGANRILTMAEKQSAHRIELEKTVIRGDDRRANLGLVCGFVFGAIVVYLSYLLIRDGHDVAGATLGTADLVALVGTFIYGTRARRQEREHKNEKNKALTRREG
jgi:uncharacterized membrane protein